MIPIPTNITSYGGLLHPIPMCMSCGLEIEHAAVIRFAHMCRYPEKREHDQMLTVCAACLALATAAVQR